MKKMVALFVCLMLYFSVSIPSIAQTNDSGLVQPATSKIIPMMTTDKWALEHNDIISLTVKLTHGTTQDRTNSVAFLINYNSDAFEVINAYDGYIPFNIWKVAGTGTKKTVCAAFVNMYKEVFIKNNEPVMTVRLKVKPECQTGNYYFQLQPVEMIDKSYRVYNVNDGKPIYNSVWVW